MPGYNPGAGFTPTSGYGMRTDPISRSGSQFHPGIDFGAAAGTAIPAASAGQVIYSGLNQGGYGNTVVIKSVGADGSTFYTLYAHMNGQNMPVVNDYVNTGDTIGQVGNTGLSTAPHLHFEVLSSNAPVSNAAGGPLGFTSDNQSIRYDPSTFTNWTGNGNPYNGGAISAANPNGPQDATASNGNLLSQQINVSADGKTTQVSRDLTIPGFIDQIETASFADPSFWFEQTTNYGRNADGSSVTINGESLYAYASGQVTQTIFGVGYISNLAGAIITLSPNTSATVSGPNNTVALSSNDTLNLQGYSVTASGGIYGAATATGISIAGSGLGNIINVGSGDQATINASNAQINVADYGNATSARINGNSNAITEFGSASVFLSGTGDSVAFTSPGSGPRWSPYLYMADGGAVAVSSSAGSPGGNLYGSHVTFNLADNTSGFINLQGSNDTVNAGLNDLIDIAGQSEIVNAGKSDHIQVLDHASVSVVGSGDQLDILGVGASLTASHENIFIGVGGSNINDFVFGSYDVFSGGAAATDGLYVQGQYDTGRLTGVSPVFQGDVTGDLIFAPFNYSQTINLPSYYVPGGEDCEDGIDPIVLNLAGGRVTTQALSTSSAYFDMLDNGKRIHTGWGTAGEGYLVYDPAETGIVTNEQSLVPGFRALAALDANHDGVLNSQDAAWAHLKVWVDSAGTGLFQSGSLRTVDATGIASINLNATHVNQNNNYNQILDDSTFTWKTGGTGDIAGVAFTFDSNPYVAPRGGGGGCVHCLSLLPDGQTAGDMAVGATMQLADEKTLEPGAGIVSYSQRKTMPGVRFVTEGGFSLVCSESAPIPTPEGLLLAPALFGKLVAVRKDEGGGSQVGWAKVIKLESVGPIEVQHITVGDKCFWAGERDGMFILHHNQKNIP